MVWKIIGSICFIAALSILGVWIAHGRHNVTKNKVQVVTKRINPDFGVEEELVEWKDEFHLGLDYSLPPMIGCVVIGFGSFAFGRYRHNKHHA
jgi:hypothetical protein